MTAYLLPLLFLGVFLFAVFKKVKIYDSFTEGVKGTLPLLFSLFPYLAGVLILSELFTLSGLSAFLSKLLAPVFDFVGIPSELSMLVLMKPFSGSGSTALLSEVLKTYGADSYLGRCASVVFGSGETVFYLSAVYFSSTKRKGLVKITLISLFSNFVACIFGCFICRVL